MTRKEIIKLIEKNEIKVIGKRTDAKVGAKDEKVMAYIKENKQEIIDIYFDEEERKQKEKQERLEKRRMERKEKLYSNPETKVYIKKKYDGKVVVENKVDEFLGIENIDVEGLKQYATDHEDGNTFYTLTVAELKELAIEKEEAEEVEEKTEREKEVERLAQVAKETGKPQVLSSTLSWDPVEGEPVTDYTMVSADGSVYSYTEKEVI